MPNRTKARGRNSRDAIQGAQFWERSSGSAIQGPSHVVVVVECWKWLLQRDLLEVLGFGLRGDPKNRR